jgi:hypothetical protein
MAILSVQKPAPGGLDITFAAAAGGGDSFPNTGKEFFLAKNASGGAITITFDAPGTCSFGLAANAAHDVAGAVAMTNGERIFGPFPPAQFNDGNGRVQVTYSGVTSLTVAVVAGNN